MLTISGANAVADTCRLHAIYMNQPYLRGESERNCQVRLGAPRDSRSHASNAELYSCPFNMLTKPRQASERSNCSRAEPLAVLRHHAGTIAQSRTGAGQKDSPPRRPHLHHSNAAVCIEGCDVVDFAAAEAASGKF